MSFLFAMLRMLFPPRGRLSEGSEFSQILLLKGVCATLYVRDVILRGRPVCGQKSIKEQRVLLIRE